MTCSFAYEFKGELDIEILRKSVNTIYNNEPIYRFNMTDSHKEPETFEFEKNSKEY